MKKRCRVQRRDYKKAEGNERNVAELRKELEEKNRNITEMKATLRAITIQVNVTKETTYIMATWGHSS